MEWEWERGQAGERRREGGGLAGSMGAAEMDGQAAKIDGRVEERGRAGNLDGRTAVLSVCPGLITSFCIFIFLCLKWYVIERYG